MSVAYAYQENRAGFQAGAARAPICAQEAASAEHQATAGATEADGLDHPAIAHKRPWGALKAEDFPPPGTGSIPRFSAASLFNSASDLVYFPAQN